MTWTGVGLIVAGCLLTWFAPSAESFGLQGTASTGGTSSPAIFSFIQTHFTDCTQAETATELCGYAALLSFYRAFTSYYQCTPAEFRKVHGKTN